MSTTTIRIEEDMKARVAAAAAAERAGKTSHAFIVDAIAQSVEQAEQDDRFHQKADRRWEEVLATGKTVAWDEARAYLAAKVSGQPARKPAARKLAR